jgi:hypothetical protein
LLFKSHEKFTEGGMCNEIVLCLFTLLFIIPSKIEVNILKI